MKHLRQYQVSCADAIFKEWETVNETVIEKPTGVGKTVLIAEVIRRIQPKRALVLAHRRQLVQQAQEKIEKFTGLNAEIEMGGQRAARHLFGACHAVVSSIQSQSPGRRGKPEDFDVLIIDEAHHCKPGNKSYMDVINHYKKNPNLKILGVTATLEPACMKFFKSVAFRYELLEAINDGYLVNIDQQMISVHGLDYSHIRTTAGDLNSGDLAAVVENEKICQGMIMGTLEVMFGVPHHSLLNLPIEQWADFLFMNGRPKKNLIFTVSVAQAKMMSDIFNRVKPGMSAWVCGDINLVTEEQRHKVGHAFEKGDLLIVCNCAIYTEGYDNPTIEMVTMARPTKSLTLYKQQVGRGTRTLTGLIDGLETAEQRLAAIAGSSKKRILILDFVGNCGRHKLVSSVDLLAGEHTEEVKERAKKKLAKKGVPQNVSELLQQSLEELQAEKLARDQEEAARKARLIAKSPYSVDSVSPFDKYQVAHQKPTAWDRANGRVFTEGQRSVLRSAGVNPDDVSYSCGKKLIGAYFNRPSDGQAKVLRRYNYPLDCTRKEASAIIDALAKNGWKRPIDPPQEAAA